MKKLMVLIFAAGLVLGGASCASAIEFKAEGEWLVGFGVGDGSFVSKTHDRTTGTKTKRNNEDKFQASQRVRLQIEAVASENLSGTLRFQIGDQPWGKAENGGALGADGKVVGVLNAYIDWMPPDTDLKVRMGLQPLALPNAAGGSSILDTDSCAAVALNYQFTENVGLSFFWARPVNDNYLAMDAAPKPGEDNSHNHNSYLDNIDLFALSLPLNFDGIEVTPFIMYGLVGANAHLAGDNEDYEDAAAQMGSGYDDPRRWNNAATFRSTTRDWRGAFWAGLPVKLTLWDPLNVEFEFNYGLTYNWGSGEMYRSDGAMKRYRTRSEGWLAKALVEYKMDWGTPGIFGWYGSGDDSNPKNGSERMPAVEAKGNFTNFMGDGNLGWAASESWYDRGLNYAGTWGIGLQIADVSFIEDLKHTFRVAYIGGTNSPSMAKYAQDSWSWAGSDDDTNLGGDLYLTTRDALVEFDFVTSYQMYENFEINFDFAYIINCIDRGTWKKADNGGSSYSKSDAWRAQLTFAYTF